MRSFPAFASSRLPTVVVGLVLTGAVAASAPAVADGHGGSHSRARSTIQRAAIRAHHFRLPHPHRGPTPLGYVEGTNRPQTSDGRPNPVAAPWTAPLLAARTVTQNARWQVAPGVTATIFHQVSVRGPVRLYLLTVKWTTPGVHVDTMNNGAVRNVGTVLDMTRRAHAVAGVNGDFYDIGVTGAPLGIDLNSQRGLLNGRLDGWNSAFYVDQHGQPHIDTLRVHSVVAGHPDIAIRTYNSPGVPPGSIGLYTPVFGSSAGFLVAHRQRQHVRMVVIRSGRVVQNSTRLPNGSPIVGKLLIGRGVGALQLASLKVGMHAPVTTTIDDSPRMALTGSQFLIHDGIIAVTDDREMAPRTAVGIDDDTHELLILAVDGRQKTSRGYTMLEMAHEMQDLGADSALNLDGGGSTTMVARHGGHLGILNVPSDGFPRRVADGLAVDYTRPVRRSGGDH